MEHTLPIYHHHALVPFRVHFIQTHDNNIINVRQQSIEYIVKTCVEHVLLIETIPVTLHIS